MTDLINDNNHIELAKASASESKKKRMKDLSSSILSNGVLHKDEEIFYGAKEDETEEGELELNIKHDVEFENIININTKKGLELEMPVIKQNTNNNNNLNNSLAKLPIQNITLNFVDDQNKNNKFYDPMYTNKRTEPLAKRQKINLNVWSILKDALGKDLSKFCVPGI
jgi:hypothetical protein